MVRFIAFFAAVGLTAEAAGSARAEFLVGLGSSTVNNNLLVRFDSAAPAVAATSVVTGLVAGDNLVSIDYRPTTGVLYGLGRNNNLYTLNALTGAVTSTVGLTGGTLDGAFFGVDFNPQADVMGASSLRVISNTGQNLAVNVSGAVTTQTAITGGTITSSAYTGNDANPATGTTLYGINPLTDTLLVTAAPPGGVYSTVGGLGVDASTLGGFDISGLSGTAFAVFNANLTGAQPSTLYSINLGTGAATTLGAVGGTVTPLQLRGLAALPAAAPVAAVPVPATALALIAGVPFLAGVARRRNRAK